MVSWVSFGTTSRTSTALHLNGQWATSLSTPEILIRRGTSHGNSICGGQWMFRRMQGWALPVQFFNIVRSASCLSPAQLMKGGFVCPIFDILSGLWVAGAGLVMGWWGAGEVLVRGWWGAGEGLVRGWWVAGEWLVSEWLVGKWLVSGWWMGEVLLIKLVLCVPTMKQHVFLIIECDLSVFPCFGPRYLSNTDQILTDLIR